VVTESANVLAGYASRRQAFASTLSGLPPGPMRLQKETSNLFRTRNTNPHHALDISAFSHVLNIDTESNTIEVEGMTPYADVISASLQGGLMPKVVPQLKSITVGGAISGIGIESSSFRYGLPHESVLEMDVLLAGGDVVTCTPDNAHQDLFFGMPNSYGTLGYILRVKLEAIPVKPYVQLTHLAFDNSAAFFSAIDKWSGEDIDFLDGCVLQRHQHFLTIGRFVNEAPYVSDYTLLDIYYQSIPMRGEDYLTTSDYLWRWDTDWFWCSKNLYVQSKPIRRLLGRKRLNSTIYQKIMRWNNRVGLTRRLNRMALIHTESVIQDVDIPAGNAAEFLNFFHHDIGILPIWVCPVRARNIKQSFPLFPMSTNSPYINFGFWDVVRTRRRKPRGHFNRMIEDKVTDFGGIKSLYSDVFFSHRAFWQAYNGPVYRELKTRYDPGGLLKDLYEKCVLRQ
jgi:FAD/FMN-containing dehydrogenase